MADPTPAPFPSPAPGEPPFLKLAGIGKVFPGVVANEDVSMDFRRGEIHALLGENGAGKSTLMNVVTGMYQPDAGELIVEGYGVAFPGPPAAIAAGIGMVHQHFKLVPRFTVAENLALGWNRAPAWVSPRAIEAQARELSKWFGLAVRPQARIDTLSAGEQQRVEILRVLSRGAKLLILDEPTAVLSPDEIKGLFSALRRFRDGGGAVVIITHKLDEVMAIADRCSVLRAGRLTGTHRIADTTSDRLVAEMIGRSVDLPAAYPRSTPAPSADALTPLVLDAVSVRDAAGVLRLDDVSLAVRAGEILGIAGVSGNGQPELARVMTGLDTPASGRVFLDGNPMSGAGPAGFAARGVGHVPEDRLRMALAPALGVTENGVLREYASAPVGGRLGYSAPAARRFTEALAGLAGVRLVAPAAPMRGLSGGNQQRLVLAREERIARNVLVASYPARGLDIGAIAAMRERLAAARDAGVAVVLISEDLDEILALSDRIAVLHGGRLMGEYPRADARRDEIGRLMSGQHARDGVAP